MLCKDTFSGFAIVSPRAREMDSSTRVDQKITDRVATSLTHAACEWFLIFLMFVDALLSYLLVWFASYCRLQLPCFLCSKLHRPFHWRFLLCRSHRSEVSSFISCQIHDNNLADCRDMCDDCLLSFTKKAGPNPDMHRLLLGKLGYDLLLKTDSTHTRLCSCCDKPWRSRHNSQRLVRLGFPGRNALSKPNIPTPRTISRRGSGNLKKMRDQKVPVVASGYVGGRGDGMAHVGYTELKITSDSDSEFPFSDDDAFFPIADLNIEPSHKSVHESQSEGSFKDKISKYKQPDFKDNKDTPAEVSMAELIILDDIQQQPGQEHNNATVFSELITLVDACPSSSNAIQEDNAGTVSQKENNARASKNSSASDQRILNTSSKTDLSGRSDQRATNCSSGDASSWENQNQAHDSDAFPQEVPDSPVKLEVCEKVMEPKDSDFIVEHDESGSDAKEHSSNEKDEANGDFEPLKSNDVSGSAANDGVDGDTVAKEHSSSGEDGFNGNSETLASNNVSGSVARELYSSEEDGFNGDSETLASNNVSGSVAKEHYSSEEDGFNGDSETLASNNVFGSVPQEHSGKDEDGANRDSEPSTSHSIPNEESLENHGDEESSKVTEAPSTSNETPELKHSASVESFGSINSDFEGESLVDRLKQQIEYDRKCLKDLHEELEEERNASAIAANQAMAMITRLQEEKAALHMEALQYLRMMDEQAEHDVDALEKANDLLADKEKEIQDLEMELEYYRLKFPDEPRDEIIATMGISAHKETNASSTADENKDKTPTDTKGSPKPSFNTSSVEIEKERLHISQRLRNLEKKLYQFAEGRLSKHATENGSSDDQKALTSNGSLETQEKSLERHEDTVLTVNGEPLGEENNSGDPNKESNSLLTEIAHRSLSQDKKEWITMQNEISELKKRLQTLKADRDFLELAVVTLERGKGGVELIEEIARELQELRNVGIRSR